MFITECEAVKEQPVWYTAIVWLWLRVKVRGGDKNWQTDTKSTACTPLSPCLWCLMKKLNVLDGIFVVGLHFLLSTICPFWSLWTLHPCMCRRSRLDVFNVDEIGVSAAGIVFPVCSAAAYPNYPSLSLGPKQHASLAFHPVIFPDRRIPPNV